MDQQHAKEQEHFAAVLRKKKAAKARLHREDVLQTKKPKRMKTIQNENSVTLNQNMPLNLPIGRSPLSEIPPNTNSQASQSVHQTHKEGSTSSVISEIPPNINSQGSQSVHQIHKKGSTSSVIYAHSNNGFNTPQPSTSHNLQAKNRQFTHIGSEGINLCRRFDNTSSNPTPSLSNTFQPSTSHGNSLFDDDSGDDYIYDDFEGMNFTLIITFC